MALSGVIKAAGDTYREIQKDRAERQAKERAERARIAAIRARMQRAADESAKTVYEAIEAHNAQHGTFHQITLWQDRPEPETPKCGMWTVLEDCKDPNCFRHYDEKKARATQAQESN